MIKQHSYYHILHNAIFLNDYWERYIISIQKLATTCFIIAVTNRSEMEIWIIYLNNYRLYQCHYHIKLE